MIVTIHQSAYLPWLGYFHKIALADIFVFFDTTQFIKNDFINRNKIKTPQGSAWLTVPVKLKDHFQKEIRHIEIADQKWREKHWKSIELNYKKTKYWNKYSKELKQLYDKPHQFISDLCYEQLLLIIKFLNLETKVVKSSELPQFTNKKQHLVLDICDHLGASLYISGSFGKNYIQEDNFSNRNIKLYFQDYKHPVYEQLHGEFIPCLSIIDLLFNKGPKSKNIIFNNNVTKEEIHKTYANKK